jgi:hypothetical protein
MKNLKLFFVATIATIAMLATSCSKSDETAITTPANSVVYKISVSAKSFSDGCNTTLTSYLVTTEYLSDNNVIETFNALSSFTLSNNMAVVANQRLISGNVIGVRLKLPAFSSTNPNNGRGSLVQMITIKITNNDTGEVVLNKSGNDTFDLYICTDTIYEGTLLFNTQSKTYTVNKGVWSF